MDPCELVITRPRPGKWARGIQQRRSHVAEYDPPLRRNNEVLQVLVLELSVLETQEGVLGGLGRGRRARLLPVLAATTRKETRKERKRKGNEEIVSNPNKR